MMLWVIVAVLLTTLVVPRLARRQRDVVTVTTSEPISTMHLSLSRKRTEEEKAALQAATKLLR